MSVEELIEKYPRIFQDYEGNPNQVNWTSLPEGWVDVVDTLCDTMQYYIDHQRDKPEQVRCIQMKEKFGGLRFYIAGGDDIIRGMIRMAESVCAKRCQDCGSGEDLGVTQQWIMRICRTCAIAQGDRCMENWIGRQ